MSDSDATPERGSRNSSERATTSSRPGSSARRSSATHSAPTGHIDTAYHLLLRDEAPSWLYPVTMGATTMWERWDSMLPDGSVNPGEMTSFNHYALGAVVDFLHRVVGGLESAEPGWRRVRIAPRPGGGLDPRRRPASSRRTASSTVVLGTGRHELASLTSTFRTG